MKLSYSSEKIESLRAELTLAQDETKHCQKKAEGRLPTVSMSWQYDCTFLKNVIISYTINIYSSLENIP